MLMKRLTAILYFFFAIVFLASLGVTLPGVIDAMSDDANFVKNLNQNLVTYFIAILVSASLDYVLKLMDEGVIYKKPAIITVCIVNVAVLITMGFVLYHNSKGRYDGVSIWVIIGTLISYIMWWITNHNNPAFDANASLGGSTDRKLQNG